MFARVTMFPVLPATFTPLIDAVRHQVLANSMQHPGFMRGELLTRSRIDKAIWISFWNTENDSKTAEVEGLLDQEMRILEPFVSGPAIVEGYEVSIDEAQVVVEE